MQIWPNLAEFLKLATQYAYVPVWTEFFEDSLTPVSVVQRVATESVVYLLESVEGGEHIGRFSFLGLDPIFTLKVEQEGVVLIHHGIETKEVLGTDPFAVLKKLHSFLQGPELPGLPRFYGGLVGYVGYEAVQYLEKIPVRAQSPVFPQICFTLAEKLVILTMYLKKCT